MSIPLKNDFEMIAAYTQRLNAVYGKIVLVLLVAQIAVAAKAQTTVTWKDLDSAAASNMQAVTYKTVNDSAIKFYYSLPPKASLAHKFPTIVFIHGGAWRGGNAKSFFAYAAYFAMRGMVGISIDYRLLKRPTDDINNCIADCKSAIRYIKQHASQLCVDTNRLVICGESAGGHLAACMQLLDGYNDPNEDSTLSTKPTALVLLNPVVNVTTATFLKFVDASILFAPKSITDSVVLHNQCFEKAKAISPLFVIKSALPPTLLINGMNDKITPPAYAEAFAQKANQYKSNCQLVLLPNTGHAFAVPRYKATEAETLQTVATISDFLTSFKYLKHKVQLINSNDPNWITKK